MDKNELAKAMLEWAELKVRMDTLEEQIKQGVLEEGKTVDTGKVRATYNNPRKSYQSWEQAVMEAEPDGLNPQEYEIVTVTTDWQKAATDFGVERKSWVPENAQPSVTIKLK